MDAAVKKLEIKDSSISNDNYRKNDNENAYAYQYDRKKNNYNESNSIKGEFFTLTRIQFLVVIGKGWD
jgi:hypothetical protein